MALSAQDRGPGAEPLGRNGAAQSDSASRSHSALTASDGIRQSPRGDSETVPTFGPSGRHERLNCCVKKRRTKVTSHF